MSIRVKSCVGILAMIILPVILDLAKSQWLNLIIVTVIILINAFITNKTNCLNIQYFAGVSIFGAIYTPVREYIDYSIVDWEQPLLILFGGAIGYIFVRFFFKTELEAESHLIE